MCNASLRPYSLRYVFGVIGVVCGHELSLAGVLRWRLPQVGRPMTKHDIYDEHEGFQLWNYMECDKDDEGRETWRINVEVKRDGAVVVPVVAGDQTYPDRGLA